MTSELMYRLICLLGDANVPGDNVLERVRNLIEENNRLWAQARTEAAKQPYDRLLEKLDEDPCDTLLMLHDACLDDGKPKEAAGWGWLAMNKKWPIRSEGRWHWYWGNSKVEQHHVPQTMHGLLGQGKGFPSPRKALEAVVNVIAEGKWTGDAP